MHDAATDRFESDMQAEGDKEALTIEAAAYGSGGQPDMLLVLVNGRTSENTDELFNSFLDGIAEAGVTIDRRGASTGSYQGADWRCLPLSAGQVDAVACMWREDASVGMTLDLSPGPIRRRRWWPPTKEPTSNRRARRGSTSPGDTADPA
jgi:hypothetical protein